jgi:hypothetical protein
LRHHHWVGLETGSPRQSDEQQVDFIAFRVVMLENIGYVLVLLTILPLNRPVIISFGAQRPHLLHAFIELT